jgi:hypothetical protein
MAGRDAPQWVALDALAPDAAEIETAGRRASRSARVLVLGDLLARREVADSNLVLGPSAWRAPAVPTQRQVSRIQVRSSLMQPDAPQSARRGPALQLPELVSALRERLDGPVVSLPRLEQQPAPLAEARAER